MGMAASPAAARTLSVDCNAGDRIQRAIRNAEPGDTVEVSGDCTEEVRIGKDHIRLRCINGATITGSATGRTPTISVRGFNVKIFSCTILQRNPGAGIAIVRSSSALLRLNTVSGEGTGVVITQSSYGKLIDNNQLTGNNFGIIVSAAGSADIVGNNISDNTNAGILVSRSAAADIVGNTINGNGGHGVNVTSSSHIAFVDFSFGNAGNEISGNGLNGIRCHNNASVRFGAAQDFGGGNGDTNVFIQGGGFCAVVP